MTRYRPTFVEIDLEAVARNVRLLRPAGAELMAVVKADGYGPVSYTHLTLPTN